MRISSFLIIGILCSLLIPTISSLNLASGIIANVNSTYNVVIYVTYSTCSVCPDDPMRIMFERYLDELWALRELNMDIQVRSIDIEPELERDLAELYKKLEVPDDIPMHFTLVVSIDENYLFINHVPVRIIKDFLANHAEKYRNIIVFRNELKDRYIVIDDVENIMECKIKNSIAECFLKPSQNLFPWSTLSLIVVSGFLDGINPCAFAVMLFLLTLLYTRSSIISEHPRIKKGIVLLFGLTYISAVYLTYLIIGLILREAIKMVPVHHLVSKIGVLVVIIAGIIKIKDVFWPGRGISLKLSPSNWEKTRRWMYKTSLPSTFIFGVLVALLEFPCTGGIYIAILSMLSNSTNFLNGFIYLAIYNAAFILPLIAILILATQKDIMSFSLRRWQKNKAKNLGLLEGLIYISLGVFLLILNIF